MTVPNRNHTPEYIDIGPECYTEEEYNCCLKQLGKIGRLLGGDRASFSAFSKLRDLPGSILDVGCGGGYFTKALAKKFPKANVLGIDYSSSAIDFAKKENGANNLQNLRFENSEKKAR